MYLSLWMRLHLDKLISKTKTFKGLHVIMFNDKGTVLLETIVHTNKKKEKGVTKSRKSKKNGQHNRKGTKGQTTIYKTLDRKLKIQQHEH